MRARSTFGITFFIKKHRVLNGEVPIYVRITVNGNSVDTSIKRKIALTKWDVGKCRVRGNKKEAKQLNDYLGIIRTRIFECKEDLEKERKLIHLRKPAKPILEVKEIYKATKCKETEKSTKKYVVYH